MTEKKHNNPAEVDHWLDLAVKCQENGELAQAEELYRHVLSVRPSCPAVRLLLSQVDGALAASQGGRSTSQMLLSAFQQHQSHYSAVLPYNLNWMLHDLGPVHDFLQENPIVLADIGARGGSLEELDGLKKFINYYGFDADRAECERLQENPPIGFAEFQVFPYYVGEARGLTDFHLYRSPGESSSFHPGNRFQTFFNPNLEIEKTIQLESTPLDKIIDRENLLWPEVIKLDTQGSELDILRSSPQALSSALLIEAEVEFIEMYEGQPLFHDVAKFMHERGFDLLYLNRVFQSRPRYGGESRGQLIFGDALFGRRESGLRFLSIKSLAKYVILLMNYGYADIANDICAIYPAILIEAPGLAMMIEKNKIPDTEVIARDKVLCWQLHRRRNNQLRYDSDRSWPTR